MRLRYFLLLILTFLITGISQAQTTAAANPDMASELRSSGKIYVVVLVLATIFAGIIAFLIYLERKLSKMERQSLQEK